MADVISKHSKGLLFNVGQIINDVKQPLFKDIDLFCRDGVVRWNTFLLAANSNLLSCILQPNIEDFCIILPDVSTTAVSSMLSFTVDQNVRFDAITANELEVMKLFAFTLISHPYICSQSTFGEGITPSEVSRASLDDLETSPMEASEEDSYGEESSQRPFICDGPNCGMSFDRRLHLQRHRASHSKDQQKVCDICGKIFHHEDNLKLHLRYHRDILTIEKCPECEKTFSGRRALKLHLTDVHASKAECDVCGVKMSKRLLKRHFRRRHASQVGSNVETVVCDVCQRHFSTSQALSVHQRSHEGINGFILPKIDQYRNNSGKSISTVTDDISCDVCGKKFVTRRQIVSHKRRCHSKTHVPCQDCGKLVKDMKQHHRLIHRKATKAIRAAMENKEIDCPGPSTSTPCKATTMSKTTATCRECGKDYGDKRGLARHLREVHAENRFECPLCGHFFPVRHSLVRHITFVHHPVKHECPFCGVVVIHLAVHLASAHGLDPANAKEVEEARTGKSAARTDLTLDFVIQRKRFQQQLLNEEKI